MHSPSPEDPRALAEARKKGYELRDTNVRFAAVFVFLIALLGVIGVAALWPLYRLWEAHNPGIRATPSLVRPAAPLLEPLPATDLPGVQAEEDARLTSYGWINKDARVVHIPVEEAIRAVGAKGLPKWPVAAPTVFPESAVTAE